MKLPEQIQEKLAARSSATEVLLLPSELFFCLELDRPDDVKGQELVEYVELNLEGSSPFPLDQLAWGFLTHDSEQRIFVFAAYHPRLRAAGYDEADDAWHLWPGFVAGLGEKPTQNIIRFFAHGHSLAAVYLPAGSSVPSNLVAMEVKASSGEPGAAVSNADWLAARQRLLKRLKGDDFSPEAHVCLVDAPKVDEKGGIHRRYTALRDAEITPEFQKLPGMSEDQCWQADVRDGFLLKRVRQAREAANYIWWSSIAAVGLIALLVLGQIGLKLGDLYITRQNRLYESELEAVMLIQENHELLNTINQFTQEELHPFFLLEKLNDIRPKEIYFSKAYAESYNEFKAIGEGTATVQQVNRYVEQLQQTAEIDRVESDVKVVRGVTRFELTANFAVTAPERTIEEAATPTTRHPRGSRHTAATVTEEGSP